MLMHKYMNDFRPVTIKLRLRIKYLHFREIRWRKRNLTYSFVHLKPIFFLTILFRKESNYSTARLKNNMKLVIVA